MDPIPLLLTGGILLLLSVTSLAQMLRDNQCPGCLSFDFASAAQKGTDDSTGLTYRVCSRCGCEVEAGEVHASGDLHWLVGGRGKAAAK